MDDEAAFLETIRRFPDDDAPRLIYADWLDERGDPRAEYLRLAARIAELEAQGETTFGCDVRLLHLSRQIDREWREAAGRRYDVILDSCRIQFQIGVVRAIRKQTGLGIKDTVDLMVNMPCTVRCGLLREDAELSRAMLECGHWSAEAFDASAVNQRLCEASLKSSGAIG